AIDRLPGIARPFPGIDPLGFEIPGKVFESEHPSPIAVRAGGDGHGVLLTDRLPPAPVLTVPGPGLGWSRPGGRGRDREQDQPAGYRVVHERHAGKGEARLVGRPGRLPTRAVPAPGLGHAIRRL